MKGGEQILDVLKRRLSIEPGQTTADGKYQLERVACLGCCALAPVLTIDEKIHAETSVLNVHRMMADAWERANSEDARSGAEPGGPAWESLQQMPGR